MFDRDLLSPGRSRAVPTLVPRSTRTEHKDIIKDSERLVCLENDTADTGETVSVSRSAGNDIIDKALWRSQHFSVSVHCVSQSFKRTGRAPPLVID